VSIDSQRPKAESPRFDPYRAVPGEERKRRCLAFIDHLERRDGIPDLSNRTLSKRELFFQELDAEPVRWRGALDREMFYRYLDQKAGPSIDQKVLWLLAAAKSNLNERYGVELALRDPALVRAAEKDPVRRFVLLEEVYHTRILLDACKTFGLEFELPDPSPRTRVFIHLCTELPEQLRELVVLCGEIVAANCFQILLEKTDLFSEEPGVAARLRLLVREILADELGHVAYCSLRVAPVGLRVSRWLVPMIARKFLDDTPEFISLAGGLIPFLSRLERFDIGADPDVRALAFAA